MERDFEAKLEAQSAMKNAENTIPNPGSDEEKNEEQDPENRASFFKRLEGMAEEDILSIKRAYNFGKEAHRPQQRDTGERYFEHLRSVAIILIDECKIKDPDLIVASLLHDSIEDSGIFANATQAYPEWEKDARSSLSRIFNPRVAEIVITLTKPKVDGLKLKTKEEAHDRYINNLSKAPAETILVKMADRLHNLRSLPGTTPEKQQRIAAETKTIYLPLFQKVLTEYPEEGRYMLDEMEKALAKLKIE